MITTQKIAILLTCHNRKAKTISCLRSLFKCRLPENHIIKVFLVDDGSTDDTSEVVKLNFPDVKIISGSGNLFWNRGMHLAWEYAIKSDEFDYFLWLNDDVILFEDAISNLFEYAPDNKSILVGTMCSNSNSFETTYGGFNRKSNLISPDGTAQICYEFNGNLVLVPRYVYSIIGNLDPVFHHAIGDFEYALRANKKGIKSYVSTKYSGSCEVHPSLPEWCLPEIPICKRYKVLYSPLGNSHPYYFFYFEKKQYGILVAIKHYFSIHLRATFPRLWK